MDLRLNFFPKILSFMKRKFKHFLTIKHCDFFPPKFLNEGQNGAFLTKTVKNLKFRQFFDSDNVAQFEWFDTPGLTS